MKMHVTLEMIANARTYIPLMDKLDFAAQAASQCFERVEVTLDGKGESAPPYYKENTGMKSRFMMGALVGLYLQQPFDPVEGTKWLMSADDYDRWAGSHIFNQLERLKAGNPEVRDRIYDLLGDYKDLEKRLNAEVYSLLQVMVDPVSRFSMQAANFMRPEFLQESAEELAKLKSELTELTEKHREENEK